MAQELLNIAGGSQVTYPSGVTSTLQKKAALYCPSLLVIEAQKSCDMQFK